VAREIDSFLASAAPLKASPSHQREYRCTELDYSAHLDYHKSGHTRCTHPGLCRANRLPDHPGVIGVVARAEPAQFTGVAPISWTHDLGYSASTIAGALADATPDPTKAALRLGTLTPFLPCRLQTRYPRGRTGTKAPSTNAVECASVPAF